MKKTLIALLSLAGVASAADATLVWDLTFNKSNQAIVLNSTGGAYETLSVSLGDATVADGICSSAKGTRVTISDSASPLDVMNDFSFVVQGGLNSLPSEWDILFGIGEADKWNFKIAHNGQGRLTFLEEGYQVKDKVALTPTQYGTHGTYIVTVNNQGKTQEKTSDALMTLYYNGEVIATATLGNTSCSAQDLDTFALGGRNINADNTSDFSFTNVQLYSGVLSQDQIKALSVPEPTTATLSLLALCGLAARRRRK